MKTRIITAAIGIPFIIALFLLAPMWLIGVVVGLVCAGAAYELLRCALPEAPKRVYAFSMLVAFVLPLLYSLGFEGGMGMVFLMFFIMSLELMASFMGKRKITFEMVTISILAGGVLPMMFGSLPRLGLVEGVGRYLLFLPFVVAFSSDIGAYFIGYFFGRHKLAPSLSPKKTVEGAVGGLICGTGITFLYGLLLRQLGFDTGLAGLLIFSLVSSAVSQLGDLTFSAIKRQYGIKDYGNVLPGHGGFLDRFDSFYYVIPLTMLWLDLMPIFSL